jgi:mRNA interferase RelE/StbE
MTPRRKPELYLSHEVYTELEKLPGNVRRLMISAIDELAKNPRPHNSKQLIIEGELTEIRRLRLGKWRILYLVHNGQPVILAIRQRPLYDYEDLERLVGEKKD